MRMERRQVLAVTGSALPIGLAGCSVPGTSEPELDLTVENYRTEPVELQIAVVEPDSGDRSEAVVYEDVVEIPAQSVGDDDWRLSNIGPVTEYRIEVRVGRTAKSYHYHYIPDCTDADAAYDPGVHLIINEQPAVSFQQARCV